MKTPSGKRKRGREIETRETVCRNVDLEKKNRKDRLRKKRKHFKNHVRLKERLQKNKRQRQRERES